MENPFVERTMIFYMCWGLNSHCFPMVGMVINLLVGVYVPIIRIHGFHIKGGMTIPNIRSFDPGTYQVGRKLVSPPSSFLLWPEVASQCMFVSQMAFFARISDPALGGTYMTLLNLRLFGQSIGGHGSWVSQQLGASADADFELWPMDF